MVLLPWVSLCGDACRDDMGGPTSRASFDRRLAVCRVPGGSVSGIAAGAMESDDAHRAGREHGFPCRVRAQLFLGLQREIAALLDHSGFGCGKGVTANG